LWLAISPPTFPGQAKSSILDSIMTPIKDFDNRFLLDHEKNSVSICVPVYKREAYVRKLFDSIGIQTYQNFEVIVTDDSPDEGIENLCKIYETHFELKYIRNPKTLGTPENWNEAVRHAQGQWIKIMHDDDWFADENSLADFIQAALASKAAHFIFSAYCNNYLDRGKTKNFFLQEWRLKMLVKNPAVLFSRNAIGAPSCVLYKRNLNLYYDPSLKWVVDIDFYIRALAIAKPAYINKVLINIGIGKEQVTQDCYRQRPIEIPENFYLLNKVGIQQLRNILVYDAWWRLMRNLKITTLKEIFDSGYREPVPVAISKIIAHQRLIPGRILSLGLVSKAAMLVSYLINRSRI
jgi:glycosyltransferase involved in cell wall biosynthesis